MSNIDHNITFVNSSLKVTASTNMNIENDLNKSQSASLDDLFQPAPAPPVMSLSDETKTSINQKG